MKQYDLSNIQTNSSMVRELNTVIFSLIGNHTLPNLITSNPTKEEVSTVNDLISTVSEIQKLSSVAFILSEKNNDEIIELPMTLFNIEE